jgi:hypothetical protein
MAKEKQQQKSPKKKKKTKPSTQAQLPIAEIRDGVAVLKDGTLRKVLMTSSINFALKSEQEQNSLISSYVGFLNSLDFPLQIVVQSRKLQIKPYIDRLNEAEKKQTNELLRVQIADYKAYIEQLVDLGQIMTKRFYVVVQFNPLSKKSKGFFTRFKEVLTPASAIKLKDKTFQLRKRDLDLRVRQVSGGLQSMGLQIVELDTQALIELYYSTYNPDISFDEGLGKIEDLRVENI